jgi:peptide/nickel transport system permease protein
MTSVEYPFMSPGEQLRDRLMHLVLPRHLACPGARRGDRPLHAGSMLEVIRQDFVRTARAKGLPERTVILKHALRNALIPVVTLLRPLPALPLQRHGLHRDGLRLARDGEARGRCDPGQRDYPVVMAGAFIFAVMVVIGNLVADVLYSVVDPRIRYD